MTITHTTLSAMADCLNHEYQSRSSAESAEVLASVARRMAGCIEDPRSRAHFVDVVEMSGLAVYPHEPAVCAGTGDHDGQPVKSCDECEREGFCAHGAHESRRCEQPYCAGPEYVGGDS